MNALRSVRCSAFIKSVASRLVLRLARSGVLDEAYDVLSIRRERIADAAWEALGSRKFSRREDPLRLAPLLNNMSRRSWSAARDAEKEIGPLPRSRPVRRLLANDSSQLRRNEAPIAAETDSQDVAPAMSRRPAEEWVSMSARTAIINAQILAEPAPAASGSIRLSRVTGLLPGSFEPITAAETFCREVRPEMKRLTFFGAPSLAPERRACLTRRFPLTAATHVAAGLRTGCQHLSPPGRANALCPFAGLSIRDRA